ncbi:agamous-like MADS-box protein AGL29 [Salvia divinorum]|uniref:Agamous-like MADS-box protein AGL29 n=1 Tax=Salvia divinorum TaxID=28513 RepID=A0ABD1HKN4_SALDI
MRRKIEIKLINDKSKRYTTFTKRRKGLMKKAEEFCQISDSKAVFISFSGAGNCYCLGHPDVDTVLDCYLGGSSSTKEEEAPTEAERRIGDAVESGRWKEAVRGLGLDKLDQLHAELENITRRVSLAAESVNR